MPTLDNNSRQSAGEETSEKGGVAGELGGGGRHLHNEHVVG